LKIIEAIKSVLFREPIQRLAVLYALDLSERFGPPLEVFD
tara:strand:- start:255 stop:374 length:120 start_codon:yes stop_codon:yes gene_type:complete